MRVQYQRSIFLALCAISFTAFGQASSIGTNTSITQMPGFTPSAPVSAGMPAPATNAPQGVLPSSPSTDSAATEGFKSAPKAADDAAETPTVTAQNKKPQIYDQPNSFQTFVQQATGKLLSEYGRNLFSAPSGYSPVSAAPVPNDYIIGPGDEIRLQVWGSIDAEHRVVVDRHGQINLPKVGVINLTGVRAGNLEAVLYSKIGRVFKQFSLNATLGRLRSIQIYVVGQARQPGTYTVSSLSTLINALFEVGGPGSNGSMRHIQLKREGRVLTEIDLYDFIAKGDRAGDLPLLAGDVIVFPPVGPRVAVTGQFAQPAIYELKGANSIADVLALGGGVSVLATPAKALLERIDPAAAVPRHVEDFALDVAGLKRPLRDGDILTLFGISPQFANAVTLHGNVTAPMRYPFKPSMRVNDLVISNNFLVPVSYWLKINAVDNVAGYSKPEVNLDYATIQRLNPNTLRTEIIAFNLSKALLGDPKENLLLEPNDVVRVYGPGDPGDETLDTITLQGEIVGGVKHFVWRPGFTIKDIIPNAEWLIHRYNYWQKPSGKELNNDINWDYAQIIRRIPNTLETKVITFNLGKIVLGGNSTQNLVLEPGDKINLYTTKQIAIPIAKRIRLVTLNGEVAVPGVYQVEPGETLPELLIRIGGVTSDAYLYGAVFTRESVRRQQQENLDKLVRKLESQLQIQEGQRSTNDSTDKQATKMLLSRQIRQEQVDRLKNLKSNGRISLELPAATADVKGSIVLALLPDLPLEDGDTFYIPNRPSSIAAAGEVHNENAILYRPGKTVGDLLKTVGTTENAEIDNAFVLRADGSVLPARGSSGLLGLFSFSGFEDVDLMPGDTLIVPGKVDLENGWTKFMTGLKDWTQILYQFGLGVAAWKAL